MYLRGVVNGSESSRRWKWSVSCCCAKSLSGGLKKKAKCFVRCEKNLTFVVLK